MQARIFLYNAIDFAFSCYMLMLVAVILGSWFPDIQGSKIMQFLRKMTNPYLNFFRRFIPPLGTIDLSPIAAFFALQFLEMFVKGILFR